MAKTARNTRVSCARQEIAEILGELAALYNLHVLGHADLEEALDHLADCDVIHTRGLLRCIRRRLLGQQPRR